MENIDGIYLFIIVDCCSSVGRLLPLFVAVGPGLRTSDHSWLPPVTLMALGDKHEGYVLLSVGQPVFEEEL